MARVPSRGTDQFMLRFPEGMRDEIRQAAEASGRSMNTEILARLEQSLALPIGDLDQHLILRLKTAPSYKRAEIERDLAGVFEKHFPSDPIEMTPDDLWQMSMALFSDYPEHMKPSVRARVLEMCRLLAKDDAWLPPDERK